MLGAPVARSGVADVALNNTPDVLIGELDGRVVRGGKADRDDGVSLCARDRLRCPTKGMGPGLNRPSGVEDAWRHPDPDPLVLNPPRTLGERAAGEEHICGTADMLAVLVKRRLVNGSVVVRFLRASARLSGSEGLIPWAGEEDDSFSSSREEDPPGIGLEHTDGPKDASLIDLAP